MVVPRALIKFALVEQANPALVWIGDMRAKLFKFARRSDPISDPIRATEESIDHAYAGLVYCLAGFPDSLPVHRLEEVEAARLGHRLLTE